MGTFANSIENGKKNKNPKTMLYQPQTKKLKEKNNYSKCYFCGKYQKDNLEIRITEDPDDNVGYIVPVCEECYEDLKKNS